jgi:hypothetical protein
MLFHLFIVLALRISFLQLPSFVVRRFIAVSHGDTALTTNKKATVPIEPWPILKIPKTIRLLMALASNEIFRHVYLSTGHKKGPIH